MERKPQIKINRRYPAQERRQCMRNRLIQADSRDLRFLKPESIHLVFTSPPYFDLKDYGYPGQIGRGQTWPEFYRSVIQVFREMDRLLVPGGIMAINSGTYTISPTKSKTKTRHEINLPGIFSMYVETYTTMKRVRHYVWDKISAKRLGGKPYPLKSYGYFEVEYVHVYQKPGQRQVDEETIEMSKLSKKDFQECTASIWPIHRRAELNFGKNSQHPAPFPPKLADRVVKIYSFAGDLVLDPFCGIGNTCIAAARNGRDFIGVDMNKKYLEVAKKRLGQMVGLKPFSFEERVIIKSEGEK